MKAKIVKLEIKDNELNDVLDTYYLVNPAKDKLTELKQMVEGRFDYMYKEDITDEEFDKGEELCSNIWDAIDFFITTNFIVLEVDEVYEIAY